jgi:hypothetical protein
MLTKKFTNSGSFLNLRHVTHTSLEPSGSLAPRWGLALDDETGGPHYIFAIGPLGGRAPGKQETVGRLLLRLSC